MSVFPGERPSVAVFRKCKFGVQTGFSSDIFELRSTVHHILHPACSGAAETFGETDTCRSQQESVRFLREALYVLSSAFDDDSVGALHVDSSFSHNYAGGEPAPSISIQIPNTNRYSLQRKISLLLCRTSSNEIVCIGKRNKRVAPHSPPENELPSLGRTVWTQSCPPRR